MDGDELAKLRKLMGQVHKLTYEAVKAGAVTELPDEESCLRGQCRNTCT